MSVVYVVQNQTRQNPKTGQLEPKFNLSSAEQFGRMEYLLSPTARPFSPEHAIGEMREKLRNYTSEDYLLLIGNPCLIGFAVAIAADFNDGFVKVLQWNGVERRYIPISADLVFA